MPPVAHRGNSWQGNAADFFLEAISLKHCPVTVGRRQTSNNSSGRRRLTSSFTMRFKIARDHCEVILSSRSSRSANSAVSNA
jgi:hypothetical protein